METEEVTETVAVLVSKLVIQFKKVGDDIQVHKVMIQGSGAPVDIDPQLGYPPDPVFPLGKLSKYKKNPICIGFEMGGSYYEICFPDP